MYQPPKYDFFNQQNMMEVAPPSSPTHSTLENQQRQFDRIKEQQTALKNLQDQRRTLEAQRDASNVNRMSSQQDFLSNFLSTPAQSSHGSQSSSSANHSSPAANASSDPSQIFEKFASFMRDVESKLDSMNNSMKQLHLDIQLSANKQDKDLQILSSTVRQLEQQISASQPNVPTETVRVEASRPTPSNPSLDMTSDNDAQQNDQQVCPVCSLSFAQKEIHQHIESHFGSDSQHLDRQAPSTPEGESSGFWGRLFKRKEDAPASPPSSQPSLTQSAIQPPNYSYAPPPSSQPSFGSGSYSHYQPQNPTMSYSQAPAAYY